QPLRARSTGAGRRGAGLRVTDARLRFPAGSIFGAARIKRGARLCLDMTIRVVCVRHWEMGVAMSEKAVDQALFSENPPPVIPVLVIEDASLAIPLAQALVAGGLTMLEITLRSGAALEAIRRIAAEVPAAIVGAGTVLNPAQFAAAQVSGARFIVSPGGSESLFAAAKDTGLPFLPGAVTPSEIMRALDQGFYHAKFFPAEANGGIRALQSLFGPFPQMRFCPTGGVNGQNVAAYRALPNVFTAGGSWMVPNDRLAAGDWAGIEALARDAVGQARGK